MREKTLLEKAGEAAVTTVAVAVQAFRPVVTEVVAKVREFVKR